MKIFKERFRILNLFYLCYNKYGDIMEQLFNKLNEIIKEYDNFIIVGHKNPDLDSIGSALGLYNVIKKFDKEAYIYVGKDELSNYNESFNKSLKKLKDVNFIDSIKDINNTLVIVTDVHTQNRVGCSELIDKYDVVVLDHHIKDKNYIKDTKFMYIDSNLSSMSELITFYLEFLNIEIDVITATIMLAGIEIDTNGFNLKTTSSTYEAASILMEMGADTILKQELLKETKEDYMKKASFIKNSFMVSSNIAMCIINETVTNIDLAEVAEELLTFEEVQASYVIGKLDNSTIGISARSLGEIDVSLVMKELGGGGHMSNAATQIKDKTIKEVVKEVTNLIVK